MDPLNAIGGNEPNVDVEDKEMASHSSQSTLRRSSRQTRKRFEIVKHFEDSECSDEDNVIDKKSKDLLDSSSAYTSSDSASDREQDGHVKPIRKRKNNTNQGTNKSKKRKNSAGPSKLQSEFRCLLCPKMMASHNQHHKHLEKLHSVRGEKGVQGYRCDTCSTFFTSVGLFTKHLKRSHLPYTNLPFKNKVRIRKEGPFRCEICGKQIKYKPSLITHKAYHERNRNDPTKTVECPVCHIWFKKQRILLHMTLHESDNPFKCKFAGCGKKFDGAPSLEKHVKLHMAERAELKCPHCPGTYSMEKYLRVHIKKWHSSETNATVNVRVRRTASYYVKPIHGLTKDEKLFRRRKRRVASKKLDDGPQIDLKEDSDYDSDSKTVIKEEHIDLESVHLGDLSDFDDIENDAEDSPLSSGLPASVSSDFSSTNSKRPYPKSEFHNDKDSLEAGFRTDLVKFENLNNSLNENDKKENASVPVKIEEPDEILGL